jgi:hypothetical protein
LLWISCRILTQLAKWRASAETAKGITTAKGENNSPYINTLSDFKRKI